ncbi:MAG: WYL domain-containing protein [Candidatus Melainabacteria bacterium]|nr:WYL domain-containing protein [Candidatus Melainabacteria bacterium]
MTTETLQQKPSPLNTTAYRIFKILQWLHCGPLSVEDLNQRFLADPLIKKTLSADSMWLYMNTLRMLGCKISRPTPTNGFRHELIQHPFGLYLTQSDVNTLVSAKIFAEKSFTYQEMLTLDRLFKRLLEQSIIPNKEEQLERLFSHSRSLDYEAQRQIIQRLEAVVDSQNLLRIVYESPVKGCETFFLLPEGLIYRRGAIYLHGHREEQEELSLLRVDRIIAFEQVTDRPDVLQGLQASQGQLPLVIIRFYGLNAQDFVPFGLGESVAPVLAPKELAESASDVSLRTRDFFSLRQILLERGLPFDVLRPVAFKQVMLETLVGMNELYDDPHE